MDDPTSLLAAVLPLIDTLSGEHGKLSAAVAWIGGVKTIVMPFANVMQAKITEALTDVARSPERDDDALVEKVLANRVYRIFAFTIKWLTSFKLPTMESWRAVKPPG